MKATLGSSPTFWRFDRIGPGQLLLALPRRDR
jgi:hypothetical protein